MAKTNRDVTTGTVRLNHVHILQPHANNPGQELRYHVTLLIPKTDIATKQALDAAINAAIAEGVSRSWGGMQPPLLNVPIHDGDGARPSDGMPYGAECKGHWVMSAASKTKPEVVDANVQPIIDAAEIYSGMYGRVSLLFYAYNSNGRKGVGCGLGNVQKVANGEPLSGRSSAAEDFQPVAAAGNPAGGYTTPWESEAPSQPRINPLTGLPM